MFKSVSLCHYTVLFNKWAELLRVCDMTNDKCMDSLAVSQLWFLTRPDTVLHKTSRPAATHTSSICCCHHSVIKTQSSSVMGLDTRPKVSVYFISGTFWRNSFQIILKYILYRQNIIKMICGYFAKIWNFHIFGFWMVHLSIEYTHKWIFEIPGTSINIKHRKFKKYDKNKTFFIFGSSS